MLPPLIPPRRVERGRARSRRPLRAHPRGRAPRLRGGRRQPLPAPPRQAGGGPAAEGGGGGGAAGGLAGAFPEAAGVGIRASSFGGHKILHVLFFRISYKTLYGQGFLSG